MPGARQDSAEVDTAPPEGVREAKAPTLLGEVPVGSAPVPADVPEVGPVGEGAIVATPADAATAQTSEPELPTSFVIGGSAPEGAPVTEEVPSAPVGPTPTVVTVDPSAGAGPS